MHVDVFECVCVCKIILYVCMYICVRVYIYIYIGAMCVYKCSTIKAGSSDEV